MRRDPLAKLGPGHKELSNQFRHLRKHGENPDGSPIESWSKVGDLMTASASNDKGSVSLQKQFPSAGQYTVQFDVVPIDPADPADGPIEARAIIQWVAGGNTITREVSIGSGVSVSGTANAVKVVAYDATSTGIDGRAYQVSILVTKGVRSFTGQPPLLVPPFSTNPAVLGPNTFRDFDIPQDVGVISAMVIAGIGSHGTTASSIPEQQARVEQRGPGIVPILKAYDARNFQYVPVSPGATVIRVWNLSAALSISFSVSFGIDG